MRADDHVVTCEPCGVTRNESLTEHPAEAHLNEMMDITTDPQAGVSLVRAIREE